jgi:hypothetical protein
MLRSLAPSVSPEKMILSWAPEGERSDHDESKTIVPVIFIGVPVTSPAGRVTE